MSVIALLFLGMVLFGATILAGIGKKKYGVNACVSLFIYGIIAGIVSTAITFNIVEMPESNVSISLGELSDDAREVFLVETLVDGKKITIEDTIEGKWAWRGDACGWMNMEGTVLTDITTSVVIKVPNGWVRTLRFASVASSGKIYIEENGAVQQVNIEKENVIKLKPCSRGERWGFRLLQIVVFVVVYLFICLLLIMSIKKKDIIMGGTLKYQYYLAYAGIAFLSFISMVSLSEEDSLWYDEMFTLGYAQANVPPNSSFIVWGLMCKWVKIIPYGQKFLLLLPIFVVAISVYIAGLLGKHLINGQAGCFLAALLGFSPYIYSQAAFEFRTYFMMLLMSIMTYYIFCIRGVGNGYEKNWIIPIYGISLALLMDSHEYGKLAAAAFMAMDVILVILKKIKKRNIISEIFPIIYMIYWILNNDVGYLWNNYSVSRKPDMKMIFHTLLTLCSNNKVLFGMFILGGIVVLRLIISDIQQKRDAVENHGKEMAVLVLILGVFSAAVVYSAYVNPDNSLYVDRYFISIISFVLIVAVFGINFLIESIAKKDICNVKNIFSITVVALIVVWGWSGYQEDGSFKHNQNYREAAEWISSQNDIYNEDVVVFIPENAYNVAAFHYYMSKGRAVDSINFRNIFNLDVSNTEFQKIYLVAPSFSPTEEQAQYLNDEYMLKDTVQGYPISIYEKK